MDDFPNSTLLDSVLISIGSLREKLAKKAFETGVLYLKMEEYDSAKLSFQVVIDEFYDTPYLAEAQKEMIVALAKNREIENAISFLTINETSLSRNGLYNEMAEFIDDMKLKLQKEQE